MNKKGFTLIELLLYMALMSLLFIGITSIIALIYTTHEKINMKTAEETCLVFISSYISNALNYGNLVTPALGQTTSAIEIDNNQDGNITKLYVELIAYKLYIKRNTNTYISANCPYIKIEKFSVLNDSSKHILILSFIMNNISKELQFSLQ